MALAPAPPPGTRRRAFEAAAAVVADTAVVHRRRPPGAGRGGAQQPRERAVGFRPGARPPPLDLAGAGGPGRRGFAGGLRRCPIPPAGSRRSDGAARSPDWDHLCLAGHHQLPPRRWGHCRGLRLPVVPAVGCRRPAGGLGHGGQRGGGRAHAGPGCGPRSGARHRAGRQSGPGPGGGGGAGGGARRGHPLRLRAAAGHRGALGVARLQAGDSGVRAATSRNTSSGSSGG